MHMSSKGELQIKLWGFKGWTASIALYAFVLKFTRNLDFLFFTKKHFMPLTPESDWHIIFP